MNQDRIYAFRKLKNQIMCLLLGVAAVGALVPLFLIIGYVISQGISAINWSFLTRMPLPIGEVGGGIANSIVGSILLITIASAIGIPWGIATAIYLSEYSTAKSSRWIRFFSDVLGSLPSIVIGLFVYTLLVLPMKRFSALAGGVALGVLMIPTVSRQAEELLKMIPVHVREAGLALGIPRYKVILRILLPGSLSGIATGIILALARIAGETAPLLFTALNNRFWSMSLDQPISSLPVQIYTYAISPFEDWNKQAWAGALILIFLIFSLNTVSRLSRLR